MWYFGEVADQIGIYGSKAAERLSAFNIGIVLDVLQMKKFTLTIIFLAHHFVEYFWKYHEN